MDAKGYGEHYANAIAFSLKLQETYGRDYIVLLNMIVMASNIRETKEIEEGSDAHFTAMMEMFKAADRKSTRLNSSHIQKSRMPSSA